MLGRSSPGVVAVRMRTELGGDDDLVPPAAKRPSQDLLRTTPAAGIGTVRVVLAVLVGHIEVVDPGFQRFGDDLLAGGLIASRRTELVAPQAHHGHRERADVALIHVLPLRGRGRAFRSIRKSNSRCPDSHGPGLDRIPAHQPNEPDVPRRLGNTGSSLLLRGASDDRQGDRAVPGRHVEDRVGRTGHRDQTPAGLSGRHDRCPSGQPGYPDSPLTRPPRPLRAKDRHRSVESGRSPRRTCRLRST